MNSHGDDRTRPLRTGLPAHSGATRDRAVAVLSRAQTSNALHDPRAVTRDPELVQIHAEAGRFYQACLAGSWIPGYLTSRGLDPALLATSPWKIGYAPADWTALTTHLRGLGHSDAALLCSGLVVNGTRGLRDHFHDRLMIPLRAEDGIVVAFIGRRHPDAGDDHGPKYLNSPDTELFTKGHVLAGLAEGHCALARGAQPVLVEGPLDAIAVSIAAPAQYTGIAPCGTALTGEQVAALARTVSLADRGLLVAFDGDDVGRKAAVRAYAHLVPVTGGVTAAILPEGADPADILASHGRPALAAALTTSTRPLAALAVDAAIENWAHGRELIFAELQMGALRAAATVIATLHQDDIGTQASRICQLWMTRYGWPPEDINREIIDAIERHYSRGAPSVSPAPWTAWTAIQRATAPPRQQRTASQPDHIPGRAPLRLASAAYRERDLWTQLTLAARRSYRVGHALLPGGMAGPEHRVGAGSADCKDSVSGR